LFVAYSVQFSAFLSYSFRGFSDGSFNIIGYYKLHLFYFTPAKSMTPLMVTFSNQLRRAHMQALACWHNTEMIFIFL